MVTFRQTLFTMTTFKTFLLLFTCLLATIPLSAQDGANARPMEEIGLRLTNLQDFNLIYKKELDNGNFISESVAICRYFEEIEPSPPLFGNSPESMAQVEMWNRRAENNFMMNVAMAFRNITGFFKDREKISAEWGGICAEVAADVVPAFDAQLADNEFLAGDAFSIADITFVVAYDFAESVKVEVPRDLPNIKRWYEAVSARPSFKAR